MQAHAILNAWFTSKIFAPLSLPASNNPSLTKALRNGALALAWLKSQK